MHNDDKILSEIPFEVSIFGLDKNKPFNCFINKNYAITFLLLQQKKKPFIIFQTYIIEK